MISDAKILDYFKKVKNFNKDMIINADTFEEVVFNNLPPQFFIHFSNTFYCGASRATLISRDKDFIIKIPFNQSYLEDKMFCKANSNHLNNPLLSNWDYCHNEICYYNYTKEKKNNINSFFLPIKVIGCVNGYPIYKQPYATFYKEMEKFDEKINFPDSYYALIEDKGWIGYLIKNYKGSIIKSFFDTLKELKINDLDENNIGFYKNNPVLIDYAGYFEEC